MSNPTWAQVSAADTIAQLRAFAHSVRALVPESRTHDRTALDEVIATADALFALVVRSEQWVEVVEAFDHVGESIVWDAWERAGQR